MPSALGTTAFIAVNSDGSEPPESGGEAGSRPFAVRFTTVGDAAYPTGGTSGLPAALDVLCNKQVEIISVHGLGLNGGYEPVWIPGTSRTNGKLAWVVKESGVEVANTTNLGGTTFALVAYCR